MPKPLHKTPHVSVFALVYVLLALRLPFDMADAFSVEFSGLLFAPFLAAWLGWKFGGRGMLPLWLSAPVTLPHWSFYTEIPILDYLGFGPAAFALLAFLTLVFAHRRKDAVASTRAPTPVSMALSVILIAMSASVLGVQLMAGNGVVEFLLDGAGLAAAVTFTLVASGRAPAWLAAIALAGAAAAGYVLNFESAFGVARAFGTYSAGAELEAGWGQGAMRALLLGLPAILAGLIVKDFRDSAPGQTLRRAAAGLALLSFLPASVQIADGQLRERLRQEEDKSGIIVVSALPMMATASGAPSLMLRQFDEDVIVVTGSRQRVSRWNDFYMDPGAGFLLAFFAFVVGRFGRRQTAFWLPQILAGAAVVVTIATSWAWWGSELRFDLLWAEDIMMRNMSVFFWIGAAVWTFAWIGMRGRMADLAQTGAREWPGT